MASTRAIKSSNTNKSRPHVASSTVDLLNDSKDHIAEAASEILKESRRYAQEVYKKNAQKVQSVEDNIKVYSEEVLQQVKKNPLSAVLIAGGIGFIIGALWKR